MNIPDLVKPKKDELYMRWVDSEWNFAGGCNGLNNNSSELANHWEWLFESVNALQKDDICLFGGDYVILGNGGKPQANKYGYDDGNYYATGVNGALTAAMKRGAKIVYLQDRYYSGGRNGEGKSVSCSDISNPWANCDADSPDNLCWKTGLYCGQNGWCAGCTMASTATDPRKYYTLAGKAKNFVDQGITPTYNFITYDIAGERSDDSHPHCHVKLISFYYKSSNRFSVFKGGWNLSTWQSADELKETGMGLTGLLSEPIGQLMLCGDIGHLRAFENNFEASDYYIYVPDGKKQADWYGQNVNPIRMSEYLLDNFFISQPAQPVKVGTVYFIGPSYGQYYQDFGCGAINSGRTQNAKCTGNEGWVRIVDKDVNFTLGYSPMPQGKCKTPYQSSFGGKETCWCDQSGIDQDKWSEKTNNWLSVDPKTFNSVSGPPQVGFPWSVDLIDDFINASSYLKTIMHSQLIGASMNGFSGGASIPAFRDTITNFTKTKNWYTLTNPDMTNPSSVKNTLGSSVDSSHWYHRFYNGCGIQNPGTINTHDKLWISDIGFILGSGHPIGIHFAAYLTNNELLVTNSPGITNYMNQHFNTMYYYGYPFEIKDNSGKVYGSTKYIQPENICPNTSDTNGFCTSQNMITTRRNGWETFDGMSKLYSCQEYKCVEDVNGTYKRDNCDNECKGKDPIPIPVNKLYSCNDDKCVEDSKGEYKTSNCDNKCSKKNGKDHDDIKKYTIYIYIIIIIIILLIIGLVIYNKYHKE